jgi:Thymidine kinase
VTQTCAEAAEAPETLCLLAPRLPWKACAGAWWNVSVLARVNSMCFGTDVAKYAEKWANEGKIVAIAALDGTFERRPFDNIVALLPLAEDVRKLKAGSFRRAPHCCHHPRPPGWRLSILDACTGCVVDLVSITDTNKTRLVLFGMQNRSCGPLLAATHRVVISVMASVDDFPVLRWDDWPRCCVTWCVPVAANGSQHK